jgi:hypothetical protein
MQTDYAIFQDRKLVIADIEGRLNFQKAQQALREVSSDPQFKECLEVLIDLRDVESNLSIGEVFELANSLESPNSILPTHRKIAVVTSSEGARDRAKLLERCGQNRGVRLMS